jgi:SulP family sulfate permease
MKRDLFSGLVVASFALPLCLAFGAATGLGPAAGLLTSVAAGFVAALLGGSRVQVTGPSAVFIVVVTGIVAVHGIAGLALATLLAGVLLAGFGALRLAPVFRRLPEPILVGFTAGIAVTLVVSQLKDLLGLTAPRLPVELFSNLAALAGLVSGTNLAALGLGTLTFVGVLSAERLLPKVPWALVAVVAGAAAVSGAHVSVPTLGGAFGPLTLAFHPFDFSSLTYRGVVDLLPSAFTLAFLGAVESLLSAGVADGLIPARHSPRRELIGQGAANAVSALLGGLPANGDVGRTVANLRSGGRSRLAAVVHSVVLCLVWAFLGFLASSVPLAVLAGLVISAAVRLVDFREFRLILKTTRADAMALVTTLVLTVAADLAFAVISGLLVALLFFARGVADRAKTVPSTRPELAQLPPGVHVVDLNGAFFFGASAQFDEAIRPLLDRANTVLLRRMR